MNLKSFKQYVSSLFFNWIFWLPIILCCAQQLISIRNKNDFFESIREPSIYAFVLLLSILYYVRKITRYLDVSDPIAYNYPKRLIKQSLYGFLVPFSLLLFLATIYDYINDDFIQVAYLGKELSFIALILYVFNGVYIAIALEKQLTDVSVSPQVEIEQCYHEKVLVYHRGVYVPINLMEIAMIYQSGQINWLVTFNNEEYILNLSLKEVGSILNSKQFFKVNRSQIVHKEAIQNFRPGTYGKIELMLKMNAKITTVSKDRAKDFRKWFY